MQNFSEKNEKVIIEILLVIFVFIFLLKNLQIFFLVLPIFLVLYSKSPKFKSFINNSFKKFLNRNSFNSKNAFTKAETVSAKKVNSFSEKFTNIMKAKNILLIVGIVLFILLALNSFVVISAGKTGVQHTFGKVKDKELRSGFHIINPLSKVTKLTVRTEQYTMSETSGEGQKVGDDSIEALTREGLSIKIDLTVRYHLIEDKASDVYKALGENYEEKIIRPEIRSAIREVIAEYTSKDIYSEKRTEVAQQIESKLRENIKDRGIEVEQVLLRNVLLPSNLAKSIEEKLQAEQESQRYDFVLEKEKKEAERKKIEAEGQRDAQKIIDESLSQKYLNYLYIKELKDRAGTIYVPTDSSTGIPLFKNIQ